MLISAEKFILRPFFLVTTLRLTIFLDVSKMRQFPRQFLLIITEIAVCVASKSSSTLFNI